MGDHGPHDLPWVLLNVCENGGVEPPFEEEPFLKWGFRPHRELRGGILVRPPSHLMFGAICSCLEN